MGMKTRQHRENLRLLRPWYAHTDIWEVTWYRDHLPRGVLAIVGPRRCDPVFGPTLELRVLERGFEVFVSSDEDDGRYTVPMDEDGLRRLVRELERSAGGTLVPGAPRALRLDEAAFLLKAAYVVLDGEDSGPSPQVSGDRPGNSETTGCRFEEQAAGLERRRRRRARLFPCNPGALHWSGPHGGWFRPQGRLHVVDDAGLFPKLAARSRAGQDSLAARLIVEANEELIPTMRALRSEQVGTSRVAFLVKEGTCRRQHPGRGVLHHEATQVLVIDPAGLSEEAFEEQMVKLAGEVARRLGQDEVLLEIQKNGLMQRVIGITPD